MANDDDIISILGSKSDQIIGTKCSKHPGGAGVSTCDSCNRFLCGECIGPPTEFYFRVYYYCKDEACQRAYISALRPRIRRALILLWGLAFPALTLLTYLAMNIAVHADEFTLAYIVPSIVCSASAIATYARILQGKVK
jgi:hypothetical protein